MIKIYKALSQNGLRSKLILQIHDELVFECPEDEVGKVSALVKDIMSNAVKIDVPLKVEIGTGASWGSAKS